jgi:hypothetical protein
MSDRHHRRAMRAYPWLLALVVASVLQSETPVFAAAHAYAGEAPGAFDAGVPAERRCKRTPKEEVCDWVKGDRTQKKTR